jgi:catechol 2,3-dioxygenase-like lactoylglutathione lyase family enzyme
MRRRFWTILLTAIGILTGTAAYTQEDTLVRPDYAIHFSRVNLSVADVDRSAEWYQQHLGFTPDSTETVGGESRRLLRLGDFTVALSRPADFMPLGEARLGPNVQLIDGFFKFGFRATGFEQLVGRLQQEGVRFRGEVFYDSNLGAASVVLVDPDGNRVQLFQDWKRREMKEVELTPAFFSMVTSDLGGTLDWYREYFNMKEAYNLDMPERNIYVRLIKGPHLLIELITLPDRTVKRENVAFPTERLQGIARVGLTVAPEHYDEVMALIDGFGQVDRTLAVSEGWLPVIDNNNNRLLMR